MELTIMQVHQVIDKALPTLRKSSNRVNFEVLIQQHIQKIVPDTTNQLLRVNRVMKEHNLVDFVSKDLRELTEFGKEIVENGGWLRHLAALERDERLDRETKELTIKQLKGNIFQMKFWWLFLLASAIAGGLFGELFDWFFSLAER